MDPIPERLLYDCLGSPLNNHMPSLMPISRNSRSTNKLIHSSVAMAVVAASHNAARPSLEQPTQLAASSLMCAVQHRSTVQPKVFSGDKLSVFPPFYCSLMTRWRGTALACNKTTYRANSTLNWGPEHST